MTTPLAGMGRATLWGGIAIATALGTAAPAGAQTERVSFLSTPDSIVLSAPQGELRSAPHPTVGITFNGCGDLEMRYRYVTMTMAYNPSEYLQRAQDRVGIIQRREIPAINGISIRVSTAF